MERYLILKGQMLTEQKMMHTRLFNSHRNVFWMMDVMLVFIILFNFGAVFLTNVMVTKAEPQIELLEANPLAQITTPQYEQHPESRSIFTTFVIHSLLWLIILLGYIYYRRSIYTNTQLSILFAFVLFYLCLTGYDFWNDCGYFVGKLLS